MTYFWRKTGSCLLFVGQVVFAHNLLSLWLDFIQIWFVGSYYGPSDLFRILLHLTYFWLKTGSRLVFNGSCGFCALSFELLVGFHSNLVCRFELGVFRPDSHMVTPGLLLAQNWVMLGLK